MHPFQSEAEYVKFLEELDITELKKEIDKTLQDFYVRYEDFLQKMEEAVYLHLRLKNEARKIGKEGINVINESIFSLAEAIEMEKTSKESGDINSEYQAKGQKYISIGKLILGAVGAGIGLYNTIKASYEKRKWQNHFKERISELERKRIRLIEEKISNILYIKAECEKNKNHIVKLLRHISHPLRLESKWKELAFNKIDDLIATFLKISYIEGGCIYFLTALNEAKKSRYLAGFYAAREWENYFLLSPDELYKKLDIDDELSEVDPNNYYLSGINVLVVAFLRYKEFSKTENWKRLNDFFLSIVNNKEQGKEKQLYDSEILLPLME